MQMKSPKETDKALEKLVREAAQALGDIDPAQLPHKIRQKLAGQVDGSVDVDEYIKKLMVEIKPRDEV